jgi:hypothetical protein
MRSADASGTAKLSTPVSGHGCVPGRGARADLIAEQGDWPPAGPCQPHRPQRSVASEVFELDLHWLARCRELLAPVVQIVG